MKTFAFALLAGCGLAAVAAGEPVESVRLTLIRHAESAGDPFATPERPVRGFLTDPRGVAQARATAEALRGMRFDVAFSSPYGRALQTAEIVVGERKTEIKVLPFLREWMPSPALRDAPSTVFEELQRRDERAYAEETWKTELGEGCFDMYARIVPPFLAELARLGLHSRMGGFVADEQARGLSIVVFAHGGSLNVLLSFLLGQPPFPVGAFAFDEAGVAFVELHERRGIGYPQLIVPVPPEAAARP